jgi:hypothetical protein
MVRFEGNRLVLGLVHNSEEERPEPPEHTTVDRPEQHEPTHQAVTLVSSDASQRRRGGRMTATLG